MKPIYLDYAATTPVDPSVVKAMLPYFSDEFGNPGSLHSFGQRASAAVFEARQTIAGAINAHYSEIIFMGSATEANNLAIRGAVSYFMKKHPNVRPQILIPEIEHDCVRETAKGAAELGVEVVHIPVTKEGLVETKEIKKLLNERTAVVSVMYANNEIGAIQPISEISKIIRDFREKRNKKGPNDSAFYPLLHTDAVQAFEYLSCDVKELGVDMMTLSAHKMYGPKGVGALYVKNRELGSRKMFKGAQEKYLLSPIIVGGGQEQTLRSGTENVPAIVGFSAAAALAVKLREKESRRLSVLRDGLLSGIKKIWPEVKVNGSMKARLPNHLNIYLPGRSAEQILVSLDLAGITISSGSACSARSLEPSKVLLAIGMDPQRAANSLRITLGRQTTKNEIEQFVKVLKSLKK